MIYQPLSRSLKTFTPALTAVLAISSTVRAADPAFESAREFFKGKTMTYVVCTSPGGGYDTYGRLVAKYLEKHLPVAHVLVKNVPGAGHVIGANEIFASKPDGLTLGIFNTGLMYAQLLQSEGVKFDLRQMTWIGKAGGEPRVLVVSTKTDFRTLDDIRNAKEPLLLAGGGVGDSGYNDMMLLAHALKLKVRHVFGFGTRESQLSMMRGEAQAIFGSYSSNRQFVKDGNARFVFGVGTKEDDPSIPDAADMVTDEEGKAIVALVRSQASLLRTTAGPPGIPSDRVAYLRAVYMETIADPEFLAEAKKLDIPIIPMDGETLAKRENEALNQPPEVVSLIASVMNVEVKTLHATTELGAVEDGGKLIRFTAAGAPVDVTISGSRTTVTLDDKPADRSALTAGMTCDIEYQPDGEHEAVSVGCRSKR
jgi:tripartite-type tricarboxylate transporter receptor subunit TctC